MTPIFASTSAAPLAFSWLVSRLRPEAGLWGLLMWIAVLKLRRVI